MRSLESSLCARMNAKQQVEVKCPSCKVRQWYYDLRLVELTENQAFISLGSADQSLYTLEVHRESERCKAIQEADQIKHQQPSITSFFNAKPVQALSPSLELPDALEPDRRIDENPVVTMIGSDSDDDVEYLSAVTALPHQHGRQPSIQVVEEIADSPKLPFEPIPNDADIVMDLDMDDMGQMMDDEFANGVEETVVTRDRRCKGVALKWVKTPFWSSYPVALHDDPLSVLGYHFCALSDDGCDARIIDCKCMRCFVMYYIIIRTWMDG